jgi:GTPase
MNTLPIVAIVGQPNAGKSTLLNRIAGQPLAVTSDIAGTTRDRQYVDTTWQGVDFTLVDTAGLTLSKEELEESLNKQIDIAVEQADIIMLVVDGRLNAENMDQRTLLKFRKIKKPVFLCVNKIDSPKNPEARLAEFMRLGIKPIFGVSSISGRGIGDMLDYVAQTIIGLGKHESKIEEIRGIAVSIVGKPNVGKSSIFNQILNEERVVVSPIPGTTRTAINEYIQIDGQDFTFIDTAGLKKKEHRQAQPDIFSGFQTFKSIRRSDVCFLVVDATQEITKQDQRVAQEIHEQEKGIIILANKMDAFQGSKERLQDYISMHFPFLWMSPVFFVSGMTGESIGEAIQAIAPIYERRKKEIPQEDLDKFLAKAMKHNPPKLLRDQKKPKVFGLKQIGTEPPAFELIVNHPAAISQQFRKYVENGVIKELDFWGTPIKLRLLGKDRT